VFGKERRLPCWKLNQLGITLFSGWREEEITKLETKSTLGDEIKF